MGKKVEQKSQQSHVESVQFRRLWNNEYRRGFQEGFDEAIKHFAGTLDEMLAKHDHIATSKRF